MRNQHGTRLRRFAVQTLQRAVRLNFPCAKHRRLLLCQGQCARQERAKSRCPSQRGQRTAKLVAHATHCVHICHDRTCLNPFISKKSLGEIACCRSICASHHSFVNVCTNVPQSQSTPSRTR